MIYNQHRYNAIKLKYYINRPKSGKLNANDLTNNSAIVDKIFIIFATNL